MSLINPVDNDKLNQTLKDAAAAAVAAALAKADVIVDELIKAIQAKVDDTIENTEVVISFRRKQ